MDVSRRNARSRDSRIELRVLLKNRRSCCVCHTGDRSVQLHHIDGNRSHTIEGNLAVLCLQHHSEATAGLSRGQVGLGRKLSPDEVHAHKAQWEESVARELHDRPRRAIQTRTSQLRTLFEFEILKRKNEIMILNRRVDMEKHYGFFSQLLIEEFVSGLPLRRFVVKAYSDIALQSAGAPHLVLPLIQAVLDLHPHLIGPHEVEIRTEDKHALMKSLDVLETVASYGASLEDRDTVLRSACKAMAELGEISSWYKFKSFLEGAKSRLKRVRAAGGRYDKRGLSERRKGEEIKKRQRLVDSALKGMRDAFR